MVVDDIRGQVAGETSCGANWTGIVVKPLVDSEILGGILASPYTCTLPTSAFGSPNVFWPYMSELLIASITPVPKVAVATNSIPTAGRKTCS